MLPVGQSVVSAEGFPVGASPCRSSIVSRSVSSPEQSLTSAGRTTSFPAVASEFCNWPDCSLGAAQSGGVIILSFFLLLLQ